jgi:AcrR family transcriptional regulator
VVKAAADRAADQGPGQNAPAPASPTRAPRWERRGPHRRRQEILRAARKLFSERSYDSVSTTEIARESGIARGLLNHYFGTKRELYLEVVRGMMRMPANPVPLQEGGPGIEAVIEQSVDRWLTMVERNRGTWLAALGARGPGRDPALDSLLEQAREQAADRLLEALQRYEAAQAPPELRAAIRAYSGFAEAASVQWLEYERLNRQQIHTLLVEGFLNLIRDVVPAIQRSNS